MIFKILDAYEEKIRKEDSFFKGIAKKNKDNIIFLVIMGLLVAGTVVIGIVTNWTYCVYVYEIAVIVAGAIVLKFRAKEKRAKYINNIQEYHKRLDCLKELLNCDEFSIHSENQLNTLINKIRSYIEEENSNATDRRKSNKEFYSGTILPIGAFVLGVWANKLDNIQVTAWAMVLVIVILLLKFVWKDIIDMLQTFLDPTLKEMKYLVDELQDLYDREFVK